MTAWFEANRTTSLKPYRRVVLSRYELGFVFCHRRIRAIAETVDSLSPFYITGQGSSHLPSPKLWSNNVMSMSGTFSTSVVSQF
jgi:hypothetical protein